MRPFPLSTAIFAALLGCSVANIARADATSTIEERMSYKDFTGYGLDKLSPDQLRGLNQWLEAHGNGAACAPTAATPTGGVAAPGNAPTAASKTVTSRLVGEFSGWQKGTILTLENGQRWEVRDDESVIGSHEHAPEVTIEPGLLNGWRLSVEGCNDIAHVIPVGTHP